MESVADSLFSVLEQGDGLTPVDDVPAFSSPAPPLAPHPCAVAATAADAVALPFQDHQPDFYDTFGTWDAEDPSLWDFNAAVDDEIVVPETPPSRR